MDEIFSNFTEMFNIKLVFINIMVVYLIIKTIVFFSPNEDIKRGTKQFVTGIVSLILGAIYYFCAKESLETVVCSTLLAITAYDYLIKFILKKLKIQ